MSSIHSLSAWASSGFSKAQSCSDISSVRPRTTPGPLKLDHSCELSGRGFPKTNHHEINDGYSFAEAGNFQMGWPPTLTRVRRFNRSDMETGVGPAAFLFGLIGDDPVYADFAKRMPLQGFARSGILGSIFCLAMLLPAQGSPVSPPASRGRGRRSLHG